MAQAIAPRNNLALLLLTVALLAAVVPDSLTR